MNSFLNEEKAKDEVISLLQTMIRNACVNDGVHAEEMRNIETLAKYFDSYKISYEIFESKPGRGNLLATFGEGKPRVMFGPSHVDVVPANEAEWEVPPFSAEIRDGYIWGRGAVDMLNTVASQAVAFAHLTANPEFKPKGTLMFAAVSDEEAGGIWGVKWLLENHPDKFSADYTMSEAGGLPIKEGTKKFLYQIGEKGMYPIRMKAKGIPGHGSVPLASDNALLKITEAMTKLGQYKTPLVILPFWKEFVNSLDLPFLQRKLLTSKIFLPRIITKLVKKRDPMGPFIHSLTTMTISPNHVYGSLKLNVVPGEAYGEVDIRLLPGQDDEYAKKHIRKALGEKLYNELEFEVPFYNPGNDSPTNTPLWKAIEKSVQELIPGSEIVPFVLPAVTDSRYYRARGTVSYGAALFDPNESMKGVMNLAHGRNERISINSLWLSTQFFAKTAWYMLMG